MLTMMGYFLPVLISHRIAIHHGFFIRVYLLSSETCFRQRFEYSNGRFAFWSELTVDVALRDGQAAIVFAVRNHITLYACQMWSFKGNLILHRVSHALKGPTWCRYKEAEMLEGGEHRRKYNPSKQ